MDKFTVLTGVAAPLPLVNVDTDKIMPGQFLKSIKRSGLGKVVFYEMRFHADGSENPEFVLNQAPFRTAQILLAGDNFGCGSSREHAPWGLKDFGIRCVIAPSFADIFYNNCFKNAILPITLPEATIEQMLAQADGADFTVDLEQMKITLPDGTEIAFELDETRRYNMLNGLDDIGLTLQKDAEITAFEERQKQEQPWLYQPITV